MDANLAWEIGETASALRRFYDRRARHLGVTRAQWRVMAVLARQPGSKQVELAERLDMEPITLSRILDKLEQAGHVRRLPDPADRRAWRLELTAKACPLHRELMTLAAEVAVDAFAGLSDAQIDQVRGILATVRDNVTCSEMAGDKKEVA